MNKNELWYFAHPYTCFPLAGNGRFLAEQANFNLCCIRTAKLIQAGYFVYSPICHTHPIHLAAPEFIISGERDLWMELDRLIIEKTDFKGLILAPGWKASEGCQAECEIFDKEGKPVLYYKDLVKGE